MSKDIFNIEYLNFKVNYEEKYLILDENVVLNPGKSYKICMLRLHDDANISCPFTPPSINRLFKKKIHYKLTSEGKEYFDIKDNILICKSSINLHKGKKLIEFYYE